MTDNDQRNGTDVPGTQAWPDGAHRTGNLDDRSPQQPTQIYRDNDAQGTMPFDEAQPLRGARWERANLEPGTFVRERYRVERDLGLGGGESEIYPCQDEHLPVDHGDRHVVLKLYRTDLAPKPEVLDVIHNLTSPNLIRILDMGIWDGRFFEVLEYCRGGSMADHMPYAPEALMGVLDQIVEGLDYCHQQGVIHRDIKPTNLLFRDAARTDLVITDFGISSYLRKWQEGGPDRTHTQTARRHTLDYAAPELFSDEEVSPKTDYYALGITVIHLLAGQSPVAGWNMERVIAAHTQNQIPVPTSLPARAKQLVVGLTQRDPANRWGPSQYRQWRNGESVTDAQGRPWQHRSVSLASHRPFPYLPEATTPQELAHRFDHFDAKRHLANGNIRHWAAEFDTIVADEIEKIEKWVERDPDRALRKARLLLDRSIPLHLDD